MNQTLRSLPRSLTHLVPPQQRRHCAASIQPHPAGRGTVCRRAAPCPRPRRRHSPPRRHPVMASAQDRLALLQRSWTCVAEGYNRLFVPRFMPWTLDTLNLLAGKALPAGTIAVPCCGPGECYGPLASLLNLTCWCCCWCWMCPRPASLCLPGCRPGAAAGGGGLPASPRGGHRSG